MDNKEIIRKTMSAMGWDINCDIPMANEENRRLFEEIQRLYDEKAEMIEKELHNSERLQKLQQHTKNAEIAINHNLKLLEAYQSEVRSEANLFKIVLRTHSKLKIDFKEINKDYENYQQFVSKVEKEISKRKCNITKYTNRIQWAKTTLIEWNEAMKDGNRGYQLIEMFYKDDQIRAKQQTQQRQKLQKEIDACRSKLILMYDEQKTLECTLECTANLYRTAHAERRQLVETWKQAVNQMLQCENNIRITEVDTLDHKKLVQEKIKEHENYNDKLNHIIANNHEIETTIEELNNETSDLKERIQQLSDMVIIRTNEVDIMQKELQNLASRVEQQRADNRHNSTLKIETLKQFKAISIIVDALNKKLETSKCENLSAQERLRKLEELMDTEERNMKKLNLEIIAINEFIYRSQRELANLQSENKVFLLSSNNYRTSSASLEKNIENLKKEVKHQTELHYQVSFKILQMERQILVLQGGFLDPEVEERNKEYLKTLEEQHNELIKRSQATQVQNKKLDDDMRKLTITFNDDMKQLELINFQIKEAQVYCEGGAKRVNDEIYRKQEMIVELSILKIRVYDFNKQIDECDESTYNLTKHRMILNRAIKDRSVEVKSQTDLLYLKRKHLNEELATLRVDIGERTKHIDVVKSRFELTSKLLGINTDGTLITATQLRVETAQEKQLLLDEGNLLNEKVLKAEKEIKAMENTLILLNNSNEQYRKKNSTTLDNDAAIKELEILNNKYCSLLKKLKSLQTKYNQLNKEVSEMEDEMHKLEKIHSKEKNQTSQNMESLEKLKRELNNQETKLLRADRELKQAQKNMKRDISNEHMVLIERDNDLRELESRNLNVLNQFAEIVENDYELGSIIAQNIVDRGIKLPHLLKRARSSVSWNSQLSLSLSSSSKDQSISTYSLEESQSPELSSAKLSVVSIDFSK